MDIFQPCLVCSVLSLLCTVSTSEPCCEVGMSPEPMQSDVWGSCLVLEELYVQSWFSMAEDLSVGSRDAGRDAQLLGCTEGRR